MAARTFLFDLDGTLWDTLPWYTALCNAHGCVSDVEAKLRAGRSVFQILRDEGISRDAFVQTCRTAAPPTLFPSVAPVLDALRSLGSRVGVVTNLSGAIARPVLQRTGLAARLDVIVDGSIGPPYKPHPRPLLLALSELSAEPSTALYVGDLDSDARAAHAAGLRFVWAAYGYSPCVPPSGADAVIDGLADLLTI